MKLISVLSVIVLAFNVVSAMEVNNILNGPDMENFRTDPSRLPLPLLPPTSAEQVAEMKEITFDSPQLESLVEHYEFCNSYGRENRDTLYTAYPILSQDSLTFKFSYLFGNCFNITFDFQNKKFTITSDEPEIQALLGERLNTPLDNLQIPEELIVRDGNSFQGIELRNDIHNPL